MRKRIKAQAVNMFYIHPREFDPGHPNVKFEHKAMITRYTRLSKTYPNTDKMLRQFKFDTISSIISQYEKQHGIRTLSIILLNDQ